MSESLIVTLSLIILFLPLAGFSLTILLGKKMPKIYYTELLFISLALILSGVIAFFKLGVYVDKTIIASFNWINIGVISKGLNKFIELGIKIDNLTVLMLIVVNLISLLVHFYSIEYMHGDKKYTRYFAYLGIFTFSMLGIVLTHNILMMYIFWELVGLSSYLLIGFWFEKPSAADASKKAFLVNRVGDVGMFLGILMLFMTYGTFTFDDIYHQISMGVIPFNSGFWLTVTGLLLFMGAVGKSAQFPLHVWLPDAMEGPTPVSALIHAATMVAAGVYLLTRIFVMLTADAMLVIAVIGAFTSFLAATIALTQNDIKKVLAYSTVSQLGYMVMSIGVGAYSFAFFHLVTHAFFKACLFLGSGSVIYAMHHEQDIRNMGGLRKKLPFTYYTFLIATLAISGVPLTSGFLSKDGLLASTLAFGSLTGHWLIPAAGFGVALLTAFYMFRLVILTFHGEPRDEDKFEHAHESPKLMVIPLVVLAALSFFFWYTPNPIGADQGWFLSKWVVTPQTVTPEFTRWNFMQSEHAPKVGEHVVHSHMYMEAMHHAHYPAMILSLIVAGLGILTAFLFYQWKKINADKLANAIKPLYLFSLNKWYIDEFYNGVIVKALLALTRVFAWFDSKVVDGIVNGVATLVRWVSIGGKYFDTYVVDGLVNFTAFISGLFGIILRKAQTGKVQTYIVFVVFSIIILLILL